MKFGFMFCLILSMLTGCARPSHQIEEGQVYCQRLADMISSSYVTLPSSYEKYQEQRHAGILALWGPAAPRDKAKGALSRSQGIVDLSSVSSDYDVLFQHHGKEAVVSYCLSRFSM